MAKKQLKVFHTIGGSERAVIPEGGALTVGRSYKNHIISPASTLFPDEHLFLKSRGESCQLFLLDGMTGEYTRNGVTIPVQDLIGAGVLKTGGVNHVLSLTDGGAARIVIGENILSISYWPVPPKPEKVRKKIDRSVFRPVFEIKDTLLFVFITLSFLIHGAGVQYINSIKPPEKKEGEVTKAPERFARFILSPPGKKEPPLTAKIRKIRERKIKKQKKSVKKSKKTKRPEVKKKEKGSPVSKKKIKKRRVKRPVLTERRLEIRKRVASKGVLGVITSREVVEKSEEIFQEMESFLGEVTEGSGTESLTDEITSFETISEGYGDFSEDERKIAEYRKEVKHDKSVERVKLVKKEALKTEKERPEREVGEKSRPRKKGTINRVVRTYIGGLKFLYNKALRKDNSLRGKIVVKFTISPEGRVISIELVKTTFTSDSLVKRMLKRIRKWKFPREDVDETTVIYPFVFMPVG